MTPILQSAPHQDVAPHSYVIIKTASHCRCGVLHEQSQVFAKTFFRSRTGHSYLPNLRAVRDPSEIIWNLKITVENRPVVRLPFCHECFDTVSLAHLPTPPAATKEQIARIVGGYAPQADAPKAKPKAKKPFTVDDL